MNRSAEAINTEQLSLLPPGWVWPRDPDSLMAALLRPLARELAVIEALAKDLLAEVNPAMAIYCLEDYERVLGPDPCGRDLSTMSLLERQQLAHMRWTARGGASIPYFVGLAASRGVEIEIEECHVSSADWLCADDELVESPENYVWCVNLPLTRLTVFEAGASEAGDLTFEYLLTGIECDLRRLKPAHTDIAFRYRDGDTDNPESVEHG